MSGVESTVGIGAEAHALPAEDLRGMFHVVETVLDGRLPPLGQEPTVEVETDDPVTIRDRSVLVVGEMAGVVSGDRGSIGMGGADGTAGRLDDVVEGFSREV